MRTFTQKLSQALTLVLTIAALVAGQSAWAQTFSVSKSTSGTTTTFTITRTGSNLPVQFVHYRTVCDDAVPQIHFTPVSGTLRFDANQTSQTVSVTELTPTNNRFMYTTSGYRGYRFEVLDQYGFLLAYSDRSWQTGSKVTIYGENGNINLFSIRKSTFYEYIFDYTDEHGVHYHWENWLFINDNGYANNPDEDEYVNHRYLSLPSTDFYDAGTQAYLNSIGAQLRMTFELRACEWYDGYQYVQILTDNTETCDNRSNCDDGNPGNINLSRYMACFSHYQHGEDTIPKKYTFPVLNVGNDEGAANPWGYGTDYPLKKQKFNTYCRASDGSIILNSDFQTLVLRLNASGFESDLWFVNSVFAKVYAVDDTRPTAYQDIIVSAGPYNKGNNFYISIPCDEIMATPSELYTTWGTATYYSGTGSNMLTFRGTITADAGTALRITDMAAIPKDLAGNNLKTDIINNNNITFPSTAISADPDYTITYDYAGGSVATANPTTYKWGTPTFSLNNPTRAGYTFAGWIGSNGDTPNTAVSVTNHSHGDRTYTATWTPVTALDLTGNAHDGNCWSTFYCGDAGYKINDDEHACAYTATYNSGTLTLHKLGKVIPAGTAVVIVGEDNSISMTKSTAAAEYIVDNNLHGVDVRTLRTHLGQGTFYVMGKVNGSFGFFPYTAEYMPARKAYLCVKNGAALVNGFNMEFEDDADGISLTPALSSREGAIYNVAGQRIQKMQKGINIVNGRKVLK